MTGISGKHAREVVFLSELSTQCSIAFYAGDRMRSGVVAFNDFHNEHDKVLTGSPPAEILRSAHSFLTHAGMVYRLLYSPGFEAGKPLANRLRELLEIRQLPKLTHAYKHLRHKFEHVDAVLHEFLKNYEAGESHSFEPIRVLPTAPSPSAKRFVRWISPDPLRITFGATTMHVDGIVAEIEDVKARIDPAFAKLKSSPQCPANPTS